MPEDVVAEIVATVLEVRVADGQSVDVGDTLVLLESMKMELEVKSKVAGTITYKADTGASVSAGQVIAVVS